MKKELCFQSLEKLIAENLIEQINARGSFQVLPAETVEEEQKILLHGEEQPAIRRFQRLELKPKQKGIKVSVRVEEGVIIAGDVITRQCDIFLSYTPKSREQVALLLAEFLKRASLVLVEPDVYERVKQNQGSFDPTTSPLYKAKTIQAGLGSHLFWQIFLVNQGWADFLKKPLERITLRQLRVKVRRLRSCLTFFKPALRGEEANEWQNKLRKQGEELSLLRELDVALMSIERIKAPVAQKDRLYPEHLERMLREARQEEALRVKNKLLLENITLELAEMVLWLQGQPLAPAYGNKRLEPFLWERVKQWSKNIAYLTKRYPDFSNIVEMHKIRIKVKRFRYVMMTLPEINKNTGNMLRKLKRLQDTLGFLHDEFVNSQIVSEMAGTGEENLQYEVALFKGWESAKLAAALAALPDLWEDFCEELEAWQETI